MVDWVLEHLKEDLSVKSPAYEPTPEDEALGDDHVAAKYWESYKRANPILIANLVRESTRHTTTHDTRRHTTTHDDTRRHTTTHDDTRRHTTHSATFSLGHARLRSVDMVVVIVDVQFTGLLKTAISCTGCGHRTVSVSVANGLVLPTSLDKKRSIVVTFVPDNPSATNKPTKHSVRYPLAPSFLKNVSDSVAHEFLPFFVLCLGWWAPTSVFKTSYGQDLKVGLIERLGKPLRPDQLIVTEVYGGRIAQIIGSHAVRVVRVSCALSVSP
jgi:hypothetical protein